MVDQAAAWDGFAACMARPHTRAMMGSTGSGGARPDGGRAPLEVRFARDSPLEGDGFEPSVPRHNKLVSRPRRTSPVAMIIYVGNSAHAVMQSWINRQRYAE